MSVLFNDLRLLVGDLCQNYNVTTVDSGAKDRAINRAIEYVQRKLGLPSDKKIHSFYYYDDTKFYVTPSGFNELLQVYYNTSSLIDTDNNIFRNRWFVSKDIEMIRDSAQINNKNRVSFTTINQASELFLLGSNLRGSSIVNSFDNTTGLTFNGGITGAVADTNIKKQGSASLKFDMNNSLSISTITMVSNLDISALLNLVSAYRMYIMFPTSGAAQISNIKLTLQSSVGNDYTITATTKDDGTAWSNGEWNRISWSLANVVTTGTPVSTAITSMILTFTHSGSFTAISNMRIDYLYQINPDYLNAIYYSSYKGTDTTGATPKIILDNPSDIVSFGNYAPDLQYPIALFAATILSPQLRFEENFMIMYKQQFTEVITLLSRTYPRQRNGPVSTTSLIR